MDLVYVLTNEAMPGLVKIGRTTDSLQTRLTQLSAATGVPLRFEPHFAAEVDDGVRLERTLHQLFDDHRINPKREFFRVAPEKVVLAISIGKFKEVTPGVAEGDPEEQEALEKEKTRRPRLRLDAIGIKPGDELYFSRDESIKAIVAQDNKVTLDGELLALAAAALKVLKRMGYQTTAANGALYWMFDGELLDERRRRLEAEKFDEAGPPSP